MTPEEIARGRELLAAVRPGWWLAPDMPLRRSHDDKMSEPCIFDGNGVFVADFGLHALSPANAALVHWLFANAEALLSTAEGLAAAREEGRKQVLFREQVESGEGFYLVRKP